MVETPSKQTFHRVALWTSIICLSWFFMQAVHEFGHISAALMTGGTILLIDLHPLHISHTLISPNPQPVIVIWAGPIVGVLLPLVLYLVCCKFFQNMVHLLRFFAGFCLIANGAYLGSIAIEAVGDARDFLVENVPIYFPLTFAIITVPSGFLLWNNQGAIFGIGKNGRTISLQESGIAVSMLITWIGIASFCFPITFGQ
ncbi:M50 family metallopeptidase [bacterium]|nr:M50 family metallopeptidase [bacterium]